MFEGKIINRDELSNMEVIMNIFKDSPSFDVVAKNASGSLQLVNSIPNISVLFFDKNLKGFISKTVFEYLHYLFGSNGALFSKAVTLYHNKDNGTLSALVSDSADGEKFTSYLRALLISAQKVELYLKTEIPNTEQDYLKLSQWFLQNECSELSLSFYGKLFSESDNFDLLYAAEVKKPVIVTQKLWQFNSKPINCSDIIMSL